jgi:hypothetical protein
MKTKNTSTLYIILHFAVTGINSPLLTSGAASGSLFPAMGKLLTLIISLLSTSFLAVTGYAFEGPLQVRNQFPLFLGVDAQYLESASVENSFSASLSHSSINLIRESSDWSVGLDMEITELDLRFKKSVRDFIEIGIDLPLISFNSGFMDDFITGFHDTFGFSDYGRSERPENEFLYDVTHRGVPVVQGEGGRIRVGDVRLSLKKPLLTGDPAISIKGDIEFPTGASGKGYGNGSFDTGVAVLAEKDISRKIRAYFNLGAVFPGDLKGNQNINLTEFVFGGAAVEAAFWKHVGLVAQVFVQNSPFPETGISSIDRLAVLLTIGGRYYAGRNSFELSFTEDPNTAGAPDFTLNFSFKRRF